jgi:hypothetical protein
MPKGSTHGDVLSVRARVDGDLESLRSSYAPKLGPTVQLGSGRDYPYRAYISKEGFAEAMCRASLDIDYGNFKSMVMKVAGFARKTLYAKVWSVMNDAETKMKYGPQSDFLSKPKRR